jgi:hypothetical protein
MGARETEGDTMSDEVTIWVIFGSAVLLYLLVRSLMALRRTRQRALQAGYRGISEYMLAAPRNDREKREAVDMAFRGLAICIVGIVLTPLLLFGVFPLYYGGRKITLALLGMDLLADDDDSV